MKVTITVVTSNDKPIPQGISIEELKLKTAGL